MLTLARTSEGVDGGEMGDKKAGLLVKRESVS